MQKTRLMLPSNSLFRMQNIAKTSNWHEKHQTFQVARDNMRANKIIAEEMKIANRELAIRRKARLQELLELEARMYEEELARKGLAIYKEKL